MRTNVSSQDSEAIMSIEKTKVLFHLPIPIDPENFNGTQGRVLGVLKYLGDRRDVLSVDVIAGNKFGSPEWTLLLQQEILKFVDNIFIYRGENSWVDFIHSRSQSVFHQTLLRQQLPVDSDYFAPPGYVRFFKKLLAQKAYDFIWINNLDYAHLASRLRSPLLQTVIDIHDITSRFRLVRKNIAYSKNLKFDYESNFIREVNLLNRFDTVIVDSQYERDVLSKKIPPEKLRFISSQVKEIVNSTHLTPYADRIFEYDVLFVGSDNQPNREGLQFFLSSVLPFIVTKQPKIKILIAGKISSAVKIDATLAENVTCLGYVSDLSELYLKSKLAICPLLSGAGTKFKLVEAMAYAMPIVTTVHSASALSLVDGMNSFITDDSAIYAQRVLQLISEPRLAQTLSQTVSECFASEHSNSSVYSKLDKIFGLLPHTS
jgi:glycosyltransferase involved in cell wall biosynthesis